MSATCCLPSRLRRSSSTVAAIGLRRRGGSLHRRPHPGARFLELAGDDHIPWFGSRDAIIDEVEEFLTGVRHVPEPDRVLATVVFTDIVGSTERAAALGDRRWRELLDAHHAAVRAQLARHRGREVDTAGDGFLATFDGPARAVRCAQAIVPAVRELGLEIRAGVHTGEVELMGSASAGSPCTSGRGSRRWPARARSWCRAR